MSGRAVSSGDLHFGTLADDPTGTSNCNDCNGQAVVNGTICSSCQSRQQLRNAWFESSDEGRELDNKVRRLLEE